MNTLIITNPKSGKSDQCQILKDYLKDKDNVKIIDSNRPEEIREIASEGIENKFDIIVAAGGDGTINEVINSISKNIDKVKIGIIPLGTGNDLARTLDIPIDPIEAYKLIEQGKTSKIDLIEVETENKISYCVNVSAGGFSGQVNEVLNEEMKKNWGPLAYLMGAINVLPDLKEYKTKIICDGEELLIKEVLNIVVANGRTVAGGKRVATFSSPEDGLLDFILIKNDNAIKLTTIIGKLALGLDYIDNETVIHKRVKTLEITSQPGMWFNIDGELLSKAPVKFSILPKAIEVFTGNDYIAYPENYNQISNTLEV